MNLKELGDNLAAILTGQANAKADLEKLRADFTASQNSVTDLQSRLASAEAALKAKAEDEQKDEEEKDEVAKAVDALIAAIKGETPEDEENTAEDDKPTDEEKDAAEEKKEDEPEAKAIARIQKGFIAMSKRHKATISKLREQLKTAGVREIAKIGLPAPVATNREGQKAHSNLKGTARAGALLNDKLAK